MKEYPFKFIQNRDGCQLWWGDAPVTPMLAVQVVDMFRDKGVTKIKWMVEGSKKEILYWEFDIVMLDLANANMYALLSMYPLKGVMGPSMDAIYEIKDMFDKQFVYELLKSNRPLDDEIDF